MASNINYIIIDETFPTAGIDNPSQQFRDNYTAIKNALRVAKNEIETLQLTTAKIDASNNFSGNRIIDADFTGVTGKVFLGLDPLTTAQNIDWNNGHFQMFQLGRNITYTLKNWPEAGRFGTVRVALVGDGVDYRTANFVVDGGGTLFYDKAYPVILSVFFTNKAKIIEFSSYAGSNTIYAKYLGEYDTTRYGTGGGGSDITDISELTDQNDLLFSKSYNDLTDKPDFKPVATSGVYSDLTGKPDLKPVATSGVYSDLTGRPTDLADFTNTSLTPYIKNLSTFTTDNLAEGTTNKYLTRALFDTYFASSFDQAISNIPNDSPYNSIETAATPITSSAATNTISITNSTLINYYRAGQNLKIFGANLTSADTDITDLASITLTKNGFSNTGTTTFSYKVVQFNFSSGKVGPPSLNSDIAGIDISVDPFNGSNNISINITRTSNSYGVLVYRRIIGQVNTTTYNLIAVLGTKELGSSTVSTFTDFYDFNATSWSRKTLVRNEYYASTGLVHFPLIAPVAASRGWVNATIESVDTVTNRITLTSQYNFNASIIVSHDDTAIIQATIDDRVSRQLNSLKLGDKTYLVSTLLIPSNFAIFGGSNQTVLKKLSWSTYVNSTNKMLRTTINGVGTEITVSNLKIDGNMQNQYLIDDATEISNNYAIDLRGSNYSIENVNIDNVIGGGISTPLSSNITINLCQITNGGLSDQYSYSPLIAGNSSEVLITNNKFKNFPTALDLSVTNIGVLTGNVVNNCGSGVVIYGSTKFISSPNLILGPAEEYIPGPDIFNSEYDSVNIILEDNTNFTSGSYLYQENGTAFDLTANRAFITYRVDKLRKINNVEELFGQILITGASPIQPLIGTFETGEFRFTISQANVNTLKTTYSYSNLSAVNSGYVGLAYRALLTEYVPSATISSAISPVISGGNTKVTTTVTVAVNNGITASSSFTVSNATGIVQGSTFYVPAIGAASILTVTNVVGNVVSFTPSATFTSAMVLPYSITFTSPGTGPTYYTVTVLNNTSGEPLSTPSNISIGTVVRLLDHGSTPSLDVTLGTISSINTVTNQYTITYPINTIYEAGTDGGYITVENTFVLAKGLIL